MKKHLYKLKKAGKIDFIQIELNYGRRYNEFLGYDLEQKYFFVVFYDNKYRENGFTEEQINNMIYRLECDIDLLKDDLNTTGIFNTKDEYNKEKEKLDFINKYLKEAKHKKPFKW
jgi:hypothetical protein